MSQQELSKGIVDQSVLSRIENGVLQPHCDVLKHLNKRLDDVVLNQYAEVLNSDAYDMAILVGIDASSMFDALKNRRSNWEEAHFQAAIQLCKEYLAKSLFSNLQETCELIMSHTDSGQFYVYSSYYLAVVKLLDKDYLVSIQLFSYVEQQLKVLDQALKPRLYYNLSYCHFALESYVQALWYAKLATQEFKAIDDFLTYSKSLALVGTVEGRIGKLEEAEKNLLEAYSFGQKWGMNLVDLIRIELTLADIYDSKQEFGEAINWCELVIQHAAQVDDHDSLSASYRILSRIHHENYDVQKARQYLDLAVEHSELSGNCKAKGWSYLLGTVLGESTDARIRFGLKAYDITLSERESLVHAMACEVLAKLYICSGNRKIAFRYLEESTVTYRLVSSQNADIYRLQSFLPLIN